MKKITESEVYDVLYHLTDDRFVDFMTELFKYEKKSPHFSDVLVRMFTPFFFNDDLKRDIMYPVYRALRHGDIEPFDEMEVHFYELDKWANDVMSRAIKRIYYAQETDEDYSDYEESSDDDDFN